MQPSVETAEAFDGMDAIAELTGTYLQRVSEVSAHSLAAGNWNHFCRMPL
ncbi:MULTISPECIES: hypothetical protein [unclassified Shewanella]|nr:MULTISPECIES: hypothetical protein [unclassified Shewanella]